MHRKIALPDIQKNMKKYLILLIFTSWLGYSQETKEVKFIIPSPIITAGSSIDATASGAANGKISYSHSGGTPFGLPATIPYTVTWTKDGNAFEPTNLAQETPGVYSFSAEKGIYVLNVTDANGCKAIPLSFTINQPDPLTVIINTPEIITCSGNLGTLIANAQGGYPYSPNTIVRNYTYKWYACDDVLGSNPVEIPSSNSSELKNRPKGFYKVDVFDGKNTTSSAIMELKSNNPITVTNTNKVDVNCKGGATGSIELIITGGTGSYKTTWKNLSFTSNKIENLMAGNYEYIIEDANSANCKISGIVTILEPTALLKIETNQTQPTVGLSDGSITAIATGGTAPYTYIFRNTTTTLQNGNSNNISGLPNGIYTVTVVDAKGCSVSSSSINLEALSVFITINNPILCYGAVTGILTANAKGGTLNSGADYTYQWYKNGVGLTGETKATLSNVSFGTYSVEVKDSKVTIPVSASETLTEPSEIIITETQNTAVNCYGGNDGLFGISVSGGTPVNGAYNFSVNGAGVLTNTNTTASISGLSAGNYTITVKDQNCTKLYNFTITQPLNPITIPEPTVTNVAIFGQSTGAISFAPITGGNGNYNYAWTKENDTTFNSDALNITGLKAGRYTLTVKDNKANVQNNTGCIQTKVVDITENPELTVVIDEIQSISCNGGNNGSLDAFIQGGVKPYKIDWYKLNSNTNSYDLIASNEIEINNLLSGTYKIVVTDAANPSGPFATAEAIYALGEPLLLTPNLISKTDVLCFGNTTGAITIDISGGTAPYTFVWKKNGADYATTQNLTNLGFGDYTVLITDANKCKATLPTITINQPLASLQIDTPIVTPLTGFGTQNGSIAINVTGGTASYNYAWTQNGNPTFKQDTATITNLNEGLYNVTVTDANGCPASINDIKVTQPSKLEITAITQQNFTNILCYGDKRAVLIATVTGGVPFIDASGTKYYQYKWYNILSPTVTVSTTNPTTALNAGTYALLVTDANNNTFTLESQPITEPAQLAMTFTQKNVSCKNGNDGAINIAITGGVAPYKIVWSTGTNANLTSISGLLASPNPYIVSVTDSNNCKIEQSITITEPDLFYLKNVIKTPPTTVGGNDGNIQVEVSGGTPNYNYYWYNDKKELIYQNLNQSSTTNIQNIYAGQYYLTVTDSKGCSIFEKDLDKIDPIAVSLNIININQCNGGNTASIKAIVSGGTPKYFYKWYSTKNPQIVINENEIVTGLTSGSYYVVVNDSFNMTITSTPITVVEPTKITASYTTNYKLCGDGNDWSIKTTTTGGTGNYTYLWNTQATTPNLENVLPGSYSVTITDQNGCQITENITLTAPPYLDATAVVTPPVCYNGNDGRIEVTVLNGTAPYNYLWDTGATTPEIKNLKAGNYNLTITDSKGCIIVKSYTITNPAQDIINIGPDFTLCIGQSQTIDATIPDSKATYSWTSTKGFISNQPVITVTDADTYTVVVTNGLGCQATDAVVVSNANYIVEAQFAISSQAFVNEKIVIVDISKNEPDAVLWTLPKEATIINRNKDFAEISFSAAGEYEIGLTTTKGSCTAYQSKKIIVIEGEYPNTEEDDRKRMDINIYPNPSNGNFTTDVKLDKKAGVHVKVFSLSNNVVMDSRHEEGKEEYSFQFALNGLVQGTYFILFESNEGNQLRKIIVY
jgi:hypothetical protein